MIIPLIWTKHWHITLATKLPPKPHLKNHQNQGWNIEPQRKIITSNILTYMPWNPHFYFFFVTYCDIWLISLSLLCPLCGGSCKRRKSFRTASPTSRVARSWSQVALLVLWITCANVHIRCNRRSSKFWWSHGYCTVCCADILWLHKVSRSKKTWSSGNWHFGNCLACGALSLCSSTGLDWAW